MPSVLKSYLEKINAGQLQEDADQKRAAVELERLYSELGVKKRRFFSKKQDPKGIYLYT